MKRKQLQVHLLWGIIVLALATALGVVLASGPHPGTSADKRPSTVPKPQGGPPGFEDNLATQLTDEVPKPRQSDDTTSFQESLSRAIGLSAFELATGTDGAIHIGEDSEIEGGKLARVIVRFARPEIHTEAWLLRHAKQARQLVVVLHGHNSTARSALGLEGEDYMRGIGRDFFDWGADVLAFELSNDGVVSGYVNARLSLFGGHIYGLWLTSVCGGTKGIISHGRYEEVVLYGMSNGGFVAEIASVLCEDFDRVIIDDILTDLPAHAAANTNKLFQHQQYSLYYLTPFLSTLDYLDFLRHSRADKVYTRTKSYFENNLSKTLLAGFTSAPLAKQAPLQIVFKQEEEHSPEWIILEAILNHKTSNLEGLSLFAKVASTAR